MWEPRHRLRSLTSELVLLALAIVAVAGGLLLATLALQLAQVVSS